MRKIPLWLLIESIILATLSLIVLILGIMTIGGDLGNAIFISVALPVIGFFVAVWILSYSLYKKSWRFFIYGESILFIIWFTLWRLADNGFI